MKKLVAIIAGDPESISSELIAKTWKKKQLYKNINIFVIGNYNLIRRQLKFLKIKIKIKKILDLNIKDYKKNLLIYDVPLNFRNPFDINKNIRKKYIIKCLKIGVKFSKTKKINGFINCPINKRDVFNKNFGVTEFLAKNSNVLGKEAMIIYNKKLSVCPITTHIKVKNISKSLSRKNIFNKVVTVNKFYFDKFGFKPRICILGLNPHNYEFRTESEEKKIIIPTIRKLKNYGIKVNGPVPADTAFINFKKNKFNIIIGMYHDQVLSPYKTLFNFNAINITAGLSYIRVSPDHGTGKDIIKKKLANPISLIESIKFFNQVNA